MRSSRGTLGITIERDGTIVLRAPENCPQNVIDTFFQKKKFWMYKKLAEKRLYEENPPKKEYVNGEGFPYLGRTYRLHIERDGKPLRLNHGCFEMNQKCIPKGRETFIRWYRTHACHILEERVKRYMDRFPQQPGGVKVLDLKYRWGSCSKDTTLNFHWKTVLAPMTIVDYIVVHEMAHIIEHNHTSAFWELVETVLPDYEQRKEWLRVNGKYLDI